MRRTILQLEFEQLALLMGLPLDTKIRLVESHNSTDQVHFVLEGRRMLEHGPGATAIVVCRPNPAPSAVELEENIRIALNLQNEQEEQDEGQNEVDGDDENMTEEEFQHRQQEQPTAAEFENDNRGDQLDQPLGEPGDLPVTITATWVTHRDGQDVPAQGEAHQGDGVLRGTTGPPDPPVGEDRAVRRNGTSAGEDQLRGDELRVRHEAREEVPDLHERVVRDSGSEAVRPEVVRRTRRGLLPHPTQQLRPRRVFRILRDPP